MSHSRILIMAGGTGGHIYPALAVAKYLREQGADILWLGTETGLEAGVVPDNGFQLSTIEIAGLRGNGLLRMLQAPLKLSVALFQCIKLIREYRPNAVLGMGGYVSGPGGLAAWLLRVPLYIHEQNAIAGLTNKLLAPLATFVMQGFPGTFASGDRVKTTGNPVRAEIVEYAQTQSLNGDESSADIRLLVLGGSLGARALNQAIPATLKIFGSKSGLQVWHQTGSRHLQTTIKLYEELGVDSARVEAFIEDMAAAYAWADLVLCRAGALTLAELCVCGLASVLVPFPYAVDDHQTANARYLSDAGAAILLPESELAVEKLNSVLSSLCQAREQIKMMAEKTREFAHPDATQTVGDICLGGAHA